MCGSHGFDNATTLSGQGDGQLQVVHDEVDVCTVLVHGKVTHPKLGGDEEIAKPFLYGAQLSAVIWRATIF